MRAGAGPAKASSAGRATPMALDLGPSPPADGTARRLASSTRPTRWCPSDYPADGRSITDRATERPQGGPKGWRTIL